MPADEDTLSALERKDGTQQSLINAVKARLGNHQGNNKTGRETGK